MIWPVRCAVVSLDGLAAHVFFVGLLLSLLKIVDAGISVEISNFAFHVLGVLLKSC